MLRGLNISNHFSLNELTFLVILDNDLMISHISTVANDTYVKHLNTKNIPRTW